MLKKKSTKGASTNLEDTDIKEKIEENKEETEENKDNLGKVTVSQYLKENEVSKEDFYDKLIPNLRNLDFNNEYYDKKDLDKKIKGD